MVSMEFVCVPWPGVGEDRLCACNKKMCCGTCIVDRCFKVEIASKSWQATALVLVLLGIAGHQKLASWPLPLQILRKSVADAKRDTSLWETPGLQRVETVSGNVTVTFGWWKYWHFGNGFWPQDPYFAFGICRECFEGGFLCAQKPIVGTLEKKGTTAMGSHSEVLWSSVCRCGFKVKGLACQMLYSRRRTTDFAFNSSSIDSFQRSSHKKRRARRAVSASSKYAHSCSQLCQGTFLGCFATFLQCQTQSHRQTVREDFDWWELRCECLNSNVF